MKNWKKLAGLVAVMTVVMILLTACGGGNIEGTWRIVKTAGKGAEEMDLNITSEDNMSMTFRDGKYTIEVDRQVVDNGTYKIEGNKLILDGSDETEYRVNGNKLEIMFSDATIYLER